MTGDSTPQRRKAFRRNEQLERLLNSLNDSLWIAERELLASGEDSEHGQPLLFVMGPLRSGTTLFMQLLASTGVVAYPTNLLSRFYGAPIMGARIQQLLTDPRYRFRDELREFDGGIEFESWNGKTAGALSPNEFWYFWRRFLPFGELDWLPDEELQKAAESRLLHQELVGLANAFGKPFALKASILNYNLPYLNRLFGDARFVRLRREPVSTVASILDARRRQLGSEKAWYSFRIPEYAQLRDLDPVSQAAGQLYFIDRALDKGMAGIPATRQLTVDYEEMCRSPRAVLDSVLAMLGLADARYPGPKSFSVSREVRGAEWEAIERALVAFRDREVQ